MSRDTSPISNSNVLRREKKNMMLKKGVRDHMVCHTESRIQESLYKVLKFLPVTTTKPV